MLPAQAIKELARSFGTRVNADAFEAIAHSVPLNYLAKHKNNIHQLEALLLGQANLLNDEYEDEYPKLLQREYLFLKSKYDLKPIDISIHFLRMRPGNFPTVRLAQLAMLINASTHLFSRILEADYLKEIQQWLSCTANDFWHYHYQLHTPSDYKKENKSSSS